MLRVYRPVIARPMLSLLLIALVVLVGRSLLVANAHSEAIDAAAFFDRGLRFLSGSAGDIAFNDPPFGHGLLVLPFWLMGCRPADGPVLYVQPIPVENIHLIWAVWKAVLFVPTVLIVFAWARRLYGQAAGGFAAVLLLVEPNFAGIVPVGMLDSLAVTACLAMALCWWRYFEKQTLGRLLLASFMLALAVSIKFNAAAIALAIAAYALLWWCRDWRVSWREWILRRGGAVAISAMVVVASIWALTLFDMGRPVDAKTKDGRTPLAIEHRVPAANYLVAFAEGYHHNKGGHPSYYMGRVGRQGTWSYFPVLSTYKVPIGFWVILGCAAVSLAWRKRRWEELSCAVPLAIGAAFMLNVNINSGFRHAMPVYVFAVVLAGRAMAPPDVVGRLAKAGRMVAGVGLVGVLVHGLSYHPDYLVYMNYPRQAAYLDFSDTNVDWGQGLKQVAAYLEQRKPDGRPVYLKYHGSARADIRHYIGDLAIVQKRNEPPAESGILIVSPCSIAGFFQDTTYVYLRDYRPDEVIGHTMLVFDLDRLRKW